MLNTSQIDINQVNFKTHTLHLFLLSLFCVCVEITANVQQQIVGSKKSKQNIGQKVTQGKVT